MFSASEEHLVERFAQRHLLLGKVNILLATRANSWHLGWQKKINSLKKNKWQSDSAKDS
jgi:hypothetical protein